MPDANQTKALDKALEAFSARVPYNDQPSWDGPFTASDQAMFDAAWERHKAIAAMQPRSGEHSDDAAVDQFATAMKAKLAKKRSEGRGGWDRPEECPASRLSNMLRDHVAKGDPVDVGNFAMMLHQRGERISPAEPASGAGEVCRCCGSDELSWATAQTIRTSVVQGRLTTHDVQCVFCLGCNSCSETLRTVSADDIAATLTLPATPATERAGEPVAWMFETSDRTFFGYERGLNDDERAAGWSETPLYANPPAAKVASLREALEPFAAVADWWGEDFCRRNPDHILYGCSAGGSGGKDSIRINMADAVRARQALAASTGGEA